MLQGIKISDKGVKGVTGGYKGLQWVTRGYKLLQEVPGNRRGYRGLIKRLTRGLKMGYQGPSGSSGILSSLALVSNHT